MSLIEWIFIEQGQGFTEQGQGRPVAPANNTSKQNSWCIYMHIDGKMAELFICLTQLQGYIGDFEGFCCSRIRSGNAFLNLQKKVAMKGIIE